MAISSIKPLDREKDRTVEQIFKRLKQLEEHIAREQLTILQEIEDYKSLVAEEYGQAFSTTSQNITLTNFSNDRQVEIKANKQISHDEKLQLAEEAMREAINDDIANLSDSELDGKKKQSLDNLLGIVDWAFELNPENKVSRSRILQLKQITYDHPKWRKGLELIEASEQVKGTRQYLYARERPEPGAKMESLNLNFTIL